MSHRAFASQWVAAVVAVVVAAAGTHMAATRVVAAVAVAELAAMEAE